MMDKLARELGMDPLELRRKNFIAKDEFPYETAARDRLRLGRLPRHARQAARELRPRRVPRRAGRAARAGHPPRRRLLDLGRGLRARAVARGRPAGRRPPGGVLGVGDGARAPTGSATVYSGTSPHGQGLDTCFAQIAARPARHRPREGRRDPRRHRLRARWAGAPTARARCRWAARRSPARREKVQEKAKRICAALLEAAPEDIELADGKFHVKGSPDKSMTMAEISGAAHIPPNELPADIEPGLEETSFYDPENFVFPFGAHACVVDVDVETGKVKVVRLLRGRRLRAGHQPDADRRPDPRRHRARDRPGAVRAGGLRRGGPARDRHVRGLRAAHRGGAAVLQDRPHGDAVAGQLAGRQGRRRGGHDRRHAGGDRRRARRARAARRDWIDMPLTPMRVSATAHATARATGSEPEQEVPR